MDLHPIILEAPADCMSYLTPGQHYEAVIKGWALTIVDDWGASLYIHPPCSAHTIPGNGEFPVISGDYRPWRSHVNPNTASRRFRRVCRI